MSELAFRDRPRRRRAQMNLAPLIDVLFLLLIFFMLTSSFRRAGELELSLPESSTSEPSGAAGDAEPLILVLLEDGRVSLDGRVVERASLATRLKTLKQEGGDRVLLQAAAEARHKDVVWLIDQVRTAGFAGVGLGTERVGSDPTQTSGP